MSSGSLPPELYAVICAFNADLLSQSLGGRTLLVQRLAELVRVSWEGGNCSGRRSPAMDAASLVNPVYNALVLEKQAHLGIMTLARGRSRSGAPSDAGT